METLRLHPEQLSLPNFWMVKRPVDWSLCDKAEPRFAQAMADGAIIVVNDAIVMKLWGIFAGVALKDVDIAGGKTIKAGTWVRPRFKGERDQIREAFFQGKREITLQKDVPIVDLGTFNEGRMTLDEIRKAVKTTTFSPLLWTEQARRDYAWQHRESISPLP
jgi:hypothetical protein